MRGGSLQSNETDSEGKESAREPPRSDSDQAEAGLLRETYKESELGRRLHRSGTIEEVKDSFRSSLRQNATRFEYIDFDFSLQQESDHVNISVSDTLKDRYVRCYVIAPYSDMQAERRLLAQEVFPTLRARCMQIGVHFAEVDFGWGVNQNIAERKSGILNRLLEMRQNVRTYIIGLVGERYGYTYLHDADVNQGFLDPLFISKRPTVLGLQEVELDEGPLSVGGTLKSFYYFRDARYFDQVDDTEVRRTLVSEGLLSRERLSNMKSKLRLSSVPIKDNYQDPEEVAAMILTDLSVQIANDFPDDHTSEDISTMDDMITNEYEECILKTFFGREDEMDFIDQRILGLQEFPLPTIICGEIGAGKSALMVAWSRRFVQTNSVDFFFKHYASLNNENRNWMTILKRALTGLKSFLRLRTDLPSEIDKLPGAFASWINAMPYLSAKVVFMLDAVDSVDKLGYENETTSPNESDLGMNLNWLPSSIPPNFRMLLSCATDTHAHEILKNRGWSFIHIPVLDDKSRELLIKNWIQARGIRFPAGAVDRIMKRQQAKNPLFLVQVLRAINCPDDIKPSGSMGMNLFSRSIADLVEIVLNGLEKNRGMQERAGLQEDLLSFIAVSRRGLSEFELLDLMQTPRSLFSKFFLEVRQILKVCYGLLSFSHSVFETAVQERYLHHPAIRRSVRMRLVEYFQSRLITHRTIEELPWQLYHNRQWQELSNTLTNPEIFILLSSYDAGVFDLIMYWTAMLSGELSGTDLISKCDSCISLAKAFSLSPQERLDLYFSLAEVLQKLGYHDASLPFSRRAYELEDRVTGLNPLIKIKYKVREVKLLQSKQDFDRAQSILEAVVNNLRQLVDTDGDGSISFEELRATEAGTLLLEMEEELLFLLWKAKRFSKLGGLCKAMLVREYDRPTNKFLLLDSLLFSFIERGQIDSANQFMDDCIKDSKNASQRDLFYLLSRKIGILLLQDRYQRIVEVMQTAGHTFDSISQIENFKKQGLRSDVVAIFGFALCCTGHAEDGLKILKNLTQQNFPSQPQHEEDINFDENEEEEDIEGSAADNNEQQKTSEDHDTWVNEIMLHDLTGIALRQLNQFSEAEESHKRALHLKVLAYGANDYSISFTVSEIASIHECMRQQSAAISMRRVAAQICQNSHGYTSILHFKCLLALASTHWKFGEFSRAEQLALTVLYGVESRFGAHHELIASAALMLGMAQVKLAKFKSAQDNIQRAQNLAISSWGPGHSDDVHACLAMAELHELNGDFDLAESTILKLRAEREKVLGPWSFGSAREILSLTFLYFRIGAFDEAEQKLQKSLPGLQMAYGSESLDIACILTLLALIHARKGSNSKGSHGLACALALRAYRIRCRIFGIDSQIGLQHTLFTALLLESLLFYRFAEPLFRKSFLALTQSGEGSNIMTKNIYHHYEICNKSGFSSDEWRPQIPVEYDSSASHSDPLLDAIVCTSLSVVNPAVENFSRILEEAIPQTFQQLHDEGYESEVEKKSREGHKPVTGISRDLSISDERSKVDDRTKQSTQRPSSAPPYHSKVVGVQRPSTAAGFDKKSLSSYRAMKAGDAGPVSDVLFSKYSSKSAIRSRLRMDPNSRDENGNTSLHTAVADGDLEAVRSLIGVGASVNVTNRSMETPFHLAARLGYSEVLRLLCTEGADINLAGPHGFTALHFAVEAESLEEVMFLCEQCGADISAEDDSGLTALQLAFTRANSGQDHIVEYLRRANDLLPSF